MGTKRALAALPFLPPAVMAATNYTQYTNLFLGTTNGGNMFPGVV